MELKGGVLIIGSLYWQDHLDNDRQDNLRKNWRNTHLQLNSKIMVKVPIRYGRLSNSDIYTMTFSKSSKQGTGYFIPFRRNLITTLNELEYEAKELSKAEGMDGKFIAKNGEGEVWGVLGFVTNPINIDKATIKILHDYWTKNLTKDGSFDPLIFKVGKELPCIYKSGKLKINWIKPVDTREEKLLNTFNIILAATTKQTDYPSIKKLKNKIKADKTRYYFFNNYKSGISTFQDIEVINKL